MVKAIKYVDGRRFYCKLDLSIFYFKHNYFAPMGDEPLKWVLTLNKEKPNYDNVCWIVSNADLKYIKLYK